MTGASPDWAATFSPEAEQSVLGGLLLDHSAWDRIVGLLTELDFYTADHRKIFRAIARLFEANKPVDVMTVAEYLDNHSALDDVGGLAYIAALAQNTPSAANIVYYAGLVRDRAIRRLLLVAVSDVTEAVTNPAGRTSRELVELAQARLGAISETALKGAGGPVRVNQVMAGVLAHIDDLASRKEQDPVTGLRTGYESLDAMTTGFQPGELIILAARPSMGKTSIALNICEHVAINSKKNVLFFSLEMANDQLGVRLLSSHSRLHAQRVKVGRLNEGEWKRLTDAASGLSDASIYLDEEGSLSAPELKARARRIHRECGGLHLIVIDYLQLMQTSGKSDNRANEMAEISRALKLLAKEIGCPVIALSQLNRALESRPNRRPIMSDLRDSGGIEQDADIILFVYRDEVYHEDSPDKGIAELIVGKQRNGPTGTVYANFIGEQMRFENRDRFERVPSREIAAEKRTRKAGDSAAGGYRGRSASTYANRDEVPM